VDDAAVRGHGHGQRDQRAVQLPHGRGPDRPLDGLRPPHADGLRLRFRDGPRRGRQGRRRHRLAGRHGDRLRRHPAGRGLDLDDHQRTRVGPFGDVHRRRRQAGRRPRGVARDHPERHPQGVHRAQHLHLPAGAVDAHHHGHLRVLCRGGAQLQHHLHLGISHPRSGRDGGTGTRLHAR
jgi:hypothetical protein